MGNDSHPRRRWPRRLALAAVIAGALIAVPHFIAGRILYQAQHGSHREPAGLRRLHAAGCEDLAVLYLPNPDARFTLWFFHGNAEDLGDLEPLLQRLHDAGFAVFALDYPGYGFSGGRPSEKAIYAVARRARDYLRGELKVSAGRTIIYGRSLGGGPAVQMATEERAGGLVLQSAFVSAYRVMTRWRVLPFDQFENLRKLPAVKCPVLVMHGRNDDVIPFYHGEMLLAVAPGPKRSFWVDAADHNDFLEYAGNDYWKALSDFADLCAQPGPARH